MGFHGYGESAERSFEQLALVPGAATWTVAAIEALHRFYDKRGEVIASWMTRRGREQAIRDNRAYVVACLDSVADQTGEVPRRLVLMGFSQGASMASRAACAIAQAPRFAAALAAVVTLGGDLAPEIGPDELRLFRSVLLARGDQDTWYDEQKLGADEAPLAGRWRSGSNTSLCRRTRVDRRIPCRLRAQVPDRAVRRTQRNRSFIFVSRLPRRTSSWTALGSGERIR